MRRFWNWISGGRPMTREGYALYDSVAKRNVYHWRDAYGRRWMAFGPMSLFRVPVE
jgi:hypothetical protein